MRRLTEHLLSAGYSARCWAQRQDGLQLLEAHALKTTAHAGNREARHRSGRE